jgi:predicted permease
LLVNANLATAQVPKAHYRATYDEIETRVRALPGVVSTSRSMITPLEGSEWNTNIRSDVPNPPAGDDALAYFNSVSPTYFDTLRTPMLVGRNFNRADTDSSPQVAVINQTLARKFFAGLNPLGRTFRVEGEARKLEPPVEVVGIVKDAKYESVREDTYPTVFRPLTQVPTGGITLEIRTAVAAAAVVPAIQQLIARVNTEIPIEIHTLAAQVDDSLTRERLLAALSAFFGALALLLAMIGLYGTLSYLVTGRRVEFGIRMALGASSRSILGLVMRDVAALVAGGVAAGIAISLVTGRLLGAMLFGLQPRDPATMAMAAGLLAAVSLAASFLAARRATKVDPMSALRHE